jgi:hypothetical protein
MSERIHARYLIETAFGMMAGQQSTGTLVALARKTGALPGRHAAQVESIAPRETVSGSSLPGASAPPRRDEAVFRSAEVELSWPPAGVQTGPILGTIIKPSAGLSPEEPVSWWLRCAPPAPRGASLESSGRRRRCLRV